MVAVDAAVAFVLEDLRAELAGGGESGGEGEGDDESALRDVHIWSDGGGGEDNAEPWAVVALDLDNNDAEEAEAGAGAKPSGAERTAQRRAAKARKRGAAGEALRRERRVGPTPNPILFNPGNRTRAPAPPQA
mmetsp:Transcript_21956/g.67442  ORF Transcript_21956/g.67442 Transcript_21956/m.67442 type:complete len:133 (-) Transcript_21956:140-538(-)